MGKVGSQRFAGWSKPTGNARLVRPTHENPRIPEVPASLGTATVVLR